MKIGLQVAALLAALTVGAGNDPFPRFEEIPAELLMPRNAKITVDRFGNYLVDGRVRYLIGVFGSYNNLAVNIVPTAGYPAELKWIYEDVLTYESAQRIGFDSLYVLGFPSWMKKLDPAFKTFAESAANTRMARRMLNNGLPLAVDFTATGWGAAVSPDNEVLRKTVPPDAFNLYWRGERNNHWVPYNLFHPEGRKLYERMWTGGIDELRELSGNELMLFELFNEPACNDPGNYNKERFAGYLAGEFGTVEEMNRVFRAKFRSFADAASLAELGNSPPLAVAWGKFMEQGFTEMNRSGRDAIRARFPGARVCTQLIGQNFYRVLPNSNINIFEVNRLLDAIATPTSGGLYFPTNFEAAPERTVGAPANTASIGEGILMRHLFRAMADGKPIHNPEAYAADSADGNGNVVWLDLLRGSGATYFFSWCRRTLEWEPRGSEEGGRKHAEKFSYVLTNPYAKTPESLTGIGAAKREIFRFREFFMSRERFESVPREVALMLSYPTERYGVPTGYVAKNEITAYMAALEFGHYLPDAFFEEQLPQKRAEKYKAVVTVGMKNSYPSSLQHLESYVMQGGTLIVARDFPHQDEYGNPLDSKLFDGLVSEETRGGTAELTGMRFPANLAGRVTVNADRKLTVSGEWQVVGRVNGQPAVAVRKFGAGQVCFIAPMMQDYAIAAVLGALLESRGIGPKLELRRVPQGDLAPNIEAHLSKRDGLTLAFLFNADRYPKLIEVKLPEAAECAADLFGNRLLPVREGWALIVLKANSRFMLGFGNRKALEEKFGALTAVSEAELRAGADRLEQAMRLEREQREAAEFSFRPNLAETVTLNLAPFANRGFLDDKPGDGKGGWTDQGRELSLHGVPWGTHKLLGVPCELIRFDENDGNSCIVLSSTSIRGELPDKVEGIPVGFRAAKLYFFHVAAWTRASEKGGVVLTYRIRYADGGSREIPVRDKFEIGNWWNPQTMESPRAHAAWRNLDGRCFYALEWVNPEPEREIASLDLISPGTAAVPIVIGISAERYRAAAVYRFAPLKLTGWGGCRAEVTGENSFRVVIDHKTGEWAGVRINAERPLTLPPEKLRDAVLKFTLRGGADLFGNRHPGLVRPVKIGVWSEKQVRSGEKVLPKSSAPREIAVPIADLRPKTGELENINLLMFQFLGAAEAGFEVEDLRIEY